jgi:hypothetical protein
MLMKHPLITKVRLKKGLNTVVPLRREGAASVPKEVPRQFPGSSRIFFSTKISASPREKAISWSVEETIPTPFSGQKNQEERDGCGILSSWRTGLTPKISLRVAEW